MSLFNIIRETGEKTLFDRVSIEEERCFILPKCLNFTVMLLVKSEILILVKTHVEDRIQEKNFRLGCETGLR